MPGEKLPDELKRPRWQVVIGDKTKFRAVLKEGMIFRDNRGDSWYFLEIDEQSLPEGVTVINDAPRYRLRVRSAYGSERWKPLDEFPFLTVQENPLHPYTFPARVLPAITEYQKVRSSGLGVDRVSQMLMDAVNFLIDERVDLMEQHEAFRKQMGEKLTRIEKLVAMLPKEDCEE